MPRYLEQPSAGSVRLLGILGVRTQTELAAELEVTQSCVSLWASGWRRPSSARRTLLEERLGIPRGAWDQPPAARRAQVTEIANAA
jgi:hypothetical protein